MNARWGYVATLILTLGTRILGVNYLYIEVFGIFAHLGLASFFFFDPKGSKDSKVYQRQWMLWVINGLLAIELYARASHEDLVYLGFFSCIFSFDFVGDDT